MADEEDTNWFVSIFFQFSQIFSMVAQILRLQLKPYKLLIIKSVEEHTSAQEIGHKALLQTQSRCVSLSGEVSFDS